MEHNKGYFTISSETGNTVLTDGLLYTINLMEILGGVYDKYNAFSIKLEQYICRTAQIAVIADDFLLLHMSGLNFFNGYDTLSNYNDTRVIELLSFENNNNGFNFISSCNGSCFWKSRNIIQIKTFYTRISNGSLIVNNDNTLLMFSITGLEQYKIYNPSKGIVLRQNTMRKAQLNINTLNAVSLDTRNRVFQFNNISLRNIIGLDYDKYKKFALITKSIGYSEYELNYRQAISGLNSFRLTLSGLNWYRPNRFITTTFSDMGHTKPDTNIGFGTFNSVVNKTITETYIENIFEKQSDIISLILAIGDLYQYRLMPVNAGTTTKFPHFDIDFDIIPIID